MVWKQIEATPPHVSYLLLSFFLLAYTSFAVFIRNRLHLSEPPLALIVGIILGPVALGWLNPNECNSVACPIEIPNHSRSWGWGDDIIQEFTRVIVSIQVFTVGIELPVHYARKHWRSVAMLIGPVMTAGWLISALFVHLIFRVDLATSLTIAACLTPTDPVLSASILSNSQFSSRVPKRIRDVLSAETGCNDGTSFPFLYIGIYALLNTNVGDAVKEYFLVTILWQCVLGTVIGLTIGTVFNRVLKFAEAKKYVDDAGMIVFYLLLALFSVGVGSVLGSDDFLVAFGAGYGFARDGYFKEKIKSAHLPDVVDLLLNSAMFVYLGTIIPFAAFTPTGLTNVIVPWKLVLFAVLVLLFRRMPVILALYKFTPDIRTFREALFCGWFGPMGLGALFLAMEARAMLETGTSSPLHHPKASKPPLSDKDLAIEIIWPIVSFVVVCSTFVHGFSVLGLSIASHFRRAEGERAPLLAAETDPLTGMDHESNDDDEDE